jgi:hypothetical protein
VRHAAWIHNSRSMDARHSLRFKDTSTTVRSWGSATP